LCRPGTSKSCSPNGTSKDHVSVYRWVQRSTPLLIDAAGSCWHVPNDRWFVDETYVKVSGRCVYLYRAIDPPASTTQDERGDPLPLNPGQVPPRRRNNGHTGGRMPPSSAHYQSRPLGRSGPPSTSPRYPCLSQQLPVQRLLLHEALAISPSQHDTPRNRGCRDAYGNYVPRGGQFHVPSTGGEFRWRSVSAPMLFISVSHTLKA
jgi:hypothetical protein